MNSNFWAIYLTLNQCVPLMYICSSVMCRFPRMVTDSYCMYKMFKTSEPCTKVLRAEILYTASRRRAKYKIEGIWDIFAHVYTPTRTPTTATRIKKLLLGPYLRSKRSKWENFCWNLNHTLSCMRSVAKIVLSLCGMDSNLWPHPGI